MWLSNYTDCFNTILSYSPTNASTKIEILISHHQRILSAFPNLNNMSNMSEQDPPTEKFPSSEPGSPASSSRNSQTKETITRHKRATSLTARIPLPSLKSILSPKLPAPNSFPSLQRNDSSPPTPPIPTLPLPAVPEFSYLSPMRKVPPPLPSKPTDNTKRKGLAYVWKCFHCGRNLPYMGVPSGPFPKCCGEEMQPPEGCNLRVCESCHYQETKMDVVSDYRCPTKQLGTLSTLCSGYYTEKEDGCGGWMVHSWRMNGAWEEDGENEEEIIDDLKEIGWQLPRSFLDERRLFGAEAK